MQRSAHFTQALYTPHIQQAQHIAPLLSRHSCKSILCQVNPWSPPSQELARGSPRICFVTTVLARPCAPPGQPKRLCPWLRVSRGTLCHSTIPRPLTGHTHTEVSKCHRQQMHQASNDFTSRRRHRTVDRRKAFQARERRLTHSAGWCSPQPAAAKALACT